MIFSFKYKREFLDFAEPFTPEHQEERRAEMLEKQKRKRDFIFNCGTQILDSSDDDEDDAKRRKLDKPVEEDEYADMYPEAEEEEEVEEDDEEPMDVIKPYKRTHRAFYNKLMHSEWMGEKPLDFKQNWFFMLCPVGKRCVVFASKGITLAFSKTGKLIDKFESLLPGGNRHDRMKSKSKSNTTMLDCIWSGPSLTYYVLDMMEWAGVCYRASDAKFRSFWLQSKFSEDLPEVGVVGPHNNHMIKILERDPCIPETVCDAMNRWPNFPNNKPKVDGVLFYHNEGDYTPGLTPLVVWLKPFMLQEIIGTSVNPAYLEAVPKSYVGMAGFVEDFEKKRVKNFEVVRAKSVVMPMEEGVPVPPHDADWGLFKADTTGETAPSKSFK